MPKYYKTKDLPRAAYLVCRGFECLGSIPDPDDERGFRRLFVLAYEDKNAFFQAEADFLHKNDQVSATQFYRAQKTIKRYITDLEG